MSKKFLLFRLRSLVSISLIWIVFGIVFFENLIHGPNDLGVKVSLINFTLTFGIIGFLTTASLIFYLKYTFHYLKDWIAIILKMLIGLVQFFVVAFILLLIYYVFYYNGSFQTYLDIFFSRIVHTHTFFIFLLDMGLMTFVSIMLLEVMDKYGPGMFWSMLVGEYHQPKQENRIFIFLDINESTSIAEELGHEKYFRMLRHFYRDITLPVLANDGEIYQYVGDEIVLTWRNTPENKIKSLKFIRHAFFLTQRYKNIYYKRYGKVPRFKAGIHVGEVTAGFIGVLKKELIYSGDTLNTAARIRSMCHDLNESYLLSEDFMTDFYQPHGYTINPVGEMELKGRQQPITLFSLQFD